VEPVKTQFIKNIEKDEHAHTDTDAEAGNIDQGIKLIFEEVSKAEFQIISKHGKKLN
jgi:hypothetical protein